MPVLPVLRLPDAESAYVAAARLLDAGLPHVELTATTVDWEQALERLLDAYPTALVGLGTVADVATAQRAVDVGAAFLVTPWPAPEVRALADAADATLIEGGATPAEVRGAAAFGVAKVFPAHLGGPEYIRSLLAVMPGARLMPTGGIDVASIGAWLAAGAVAVGVGSDLLRHKDPVLVIRQATEPWSSTRPSPSAGAVSAEDASPSRGT